MPPDPELLREADWALGPCGKRHPAPGLAVVPLERKILMPLVLQPGETAVFTKEIVGETTFSLRAISSDQGANSVTGVRIQVQLPNGRFLIGGNGQDAGQFTWIGSWRYCIDPEIEVNPGAKIQVTLSDNTGLLTPFVMNLLFEGCDNWYLKDGFPIPPPSVAADSPRYWGIVNENIAAPCWVAGHGPAVPDGHEDTEFTYSSDVVAIPLTGPLVATVKIPIDSGLDFQLRRTLFDVNPDATVTAGVVLFRVRAGAGYALNDDFQDYEGMTNGAEFAHDWKVRGGDAVFIDMRLADATGSGNFNIRCHLEGVRRRKV
jgi:hypothetical protein